MQKNGIMMEPYFSDNARDLLAGLTHPDPKQRLGCNFGHRESTEELNQYGHVKGSYSKGLEAIKKHKFFAKIDWE